MKTAFISFGRIAKTGLHNLIRNAWLSTSAVAIMVVTLTIIMSSFVINSALNDTVADIAGQITVSVYLKSDDKSDAMKMTREDLLKALESQENVKDVKYISSQDALAIFQEQNSDDKTLLEAFALTGSDTLPASYEVTVKDLSKVDSVVNLAKEQRFETVVDDTSVNEARRESINNIAKAQDFINIASIAAALISASISILIIFNTIRMAVFTRSDEIEIMKLIGATPRYIRAPFLFESALYGVFAGIISTLVLYSLLLGLGPRASSQLLIDPTIDFYSEHFVVIMLVIILMGIAIGLFSSMFSLSRYLRFKSW